MELIGLDLNIVKKTHILISHQISSSNEFIKDIYENVITNKYKCK